MVWLRWAIALIVLVFGVLCLNYTKGTGWEHHAEWAAANNMPPPSEWIYRMGVLFSILGAAAIGFQIGKRRKKP